MKNLFQNILYAIGQILLAIINIPIRLKFIIPVLLILVGGTAFYVNKSVVDSVGGKQFINEAMQFVEVKDVVEDHFITEVSRDYMSDAASSAIVSGLGDKWSYYMNESEYNSFKLYSANEYSGIGMTLSAVPNGFQVVTVSSGSAASDAGLSAGMIIESVDGQSIVGMELDSARTLIRSKLASKFTLGIYGSGELSIDCTKSYVSPVYYRMEKTEAGYIQIKNFEAGSGQDAIDAIEALLDQGAVALVIDIRNNPGGLAEEVRLLLDHLLPDCNLFYITDKEGHLTTFSSDSMSIKLRTCVLTNPGTYAEAEIFAQVLKEYSWATILGEPTTGMTRTQEIIELSNGGAIRLSTHAYLSANGVDLCANGGVVPDMIVYNSDESATGTTTGTTGISDGTSTTSADDQLMAALKYLS